VEDFNYFATTLFARFGNKVKFWVTINEPPSICDLGYKNGNYAPGMKGGKAAMYRSVAQRWAGNSGVVGQEGNNIQSCLHYCSYHTMMDCHTTCHVEYHDKTTVMSTK